MKVLVVAPSVPWPTRNGGAQRTFHLLKHAATAVDVHLWAVAQPGADVERARAALASAGIAAEFFPRSRSNVLTAPFRTKRERWFSSSVLERRVRTDARAFDLIQADEACVARIVPRDRPAIVQHHKLDLEFARAFAHSAPARFDAWRTARSERALAARHRHHIVCSAEDRERWLARHPGLECAIVPNGADLEELGPPPPFIERDVQRVLFLGSLDYAPNVDALAWYARSIHPRVIDRGTDVVLEVAGSGAARELHGLASTTIRIAGELTDVRPAYARAGVLVVPLRIGGGTRLKILEAAALGCPIVATTIGAEGLGLADGVHLRIADDPDAFAAAVCETLAQRDEARDRAERARAHVRDHATWTIAARALLGAWTAAAR